MNRCDTVKTVHRPSVAHFFALKRFSARWKRERLQLERIVRQCACLRASTTLYLSNSVLTRVLALLTVALDALEQALHERRLDPEDPLVHHSDRGVQYVSIRYTERLAEAGIEPSVGSRGDSYDNALAESIIGLYKTEVIRRRGPWRGLEDVEFATLEWVHWYNTQRLLEPIGNVPPGRVRDELLSVAGSLAHSVLGQRS